MARGGAWTLEEMIFLVAMKLATKKSWRRISEEFCARFGSNATAKDCESKFNKDLKKSKIFGVVKQWLENAEVPEEGTEEMEILLDAIVLLDGVPSGERRA